ncbi:uncharacterized protein LOC142629097 [Castanea sativa]|uniref:uncharacterized protein LOC142629097 n=1 Tax=Castanea sativa TaxID=21020 RepID=UPI003F649C0C
MANAFRRRPWSVRGGHLVLKQWDPALDWQEVPFATSTFWVQGEKAGKVIEIDLAGENGGAWKRFTRIQVEVELLQPLMPGIFLPRDNLPHLWISLRYEKLANVCYRCGIIGHETHVCQGKPFLIRNPFGHDFIASGSWLKAENSSTPPEIFLNISRLSPPISPTGANSNITDPILVAPASKATSASQDKNHAPRDGRAPQEYDTNVTAHYNAASRGNGTVVGTNNHASSSKHISNVNPNTENICQASPKAHILPKAQLPSRAQNLCSLTVTPEDTESPFPPGFDPPFLGLKINSLSSPNVQPESRQEPVLHSKRIKIADALDPESVKFNPKADVELLVLKERQVASGIETTDFQDAKGTAGGMCVMWKSGLMCHQVEFNKNLIAIKVSDAVCSWLLLIWDYSGNSFTWARGRWGSSAIKRRLDRGIASISWRLAFPKATISHLGAIKSDHTPILLNVNPDDSFAHRPFRFEAAWIRDNGCNSVVEKAWASVSSNSAFSKLYKKQDATREALRKWNNEVFGNCQDRINRLMKNINEVQRKSPSEENGRIEEALQLELSEWLMRSEILWKQKSRELWLKEGDKNTKFFHLSTIIRRRRNSIDAIKSEEGQWV